MGSTVFRQHTNVRTSKHISGRYDDARKRLSDKAELMG